MPGYWVHALHVGFLNFDALCLSEETSERQQAEALATRRGAQEACSIVHGMVCMTALQGSTRGCTLPVISQCRLFVEAQAANSPNLLSPWVFYNPRRPPHLGSARGAALRVASTRRGISQEQGARGKRHLA